MSGKLGDVYAVQAVMAKAPGADVDMTGDMIPEGQVVKIESMYVVDLTNANKTMRLGYKRGGSTFWIKREAPGASVYGIGISTPLILVGEEQPIARVESATANDEIHFIIRGVYL